MKVAVVLPYASFVEVNMCKAFERVGIDSWLVKSNLQRFEYRKTQIKFEKHMKTIQLPCILGNSLLRQYTPFPIMPNLFRTIKNLDVDIVNVSEHISPPTWLFSLHKKGWKTVLTEHGSTWKSIRDKTYNFLTRKILMPYIDGFVGIGLRAKYFLENLGVRNVNVIPNPIDCDLFRPNLCYNDRENIVLFVGKVDTWRGFHILLKAMKKVKKEIANVKLWIIGPQGNLSGYVRKNSEIKYFGPRSHIKMPYYYNLAKVFVHPYPSPVISGCGCALEEALACGTAVIGTTYLDFPFIWRDGEVGYVVKADPFSLANAIIEVLSNGNKMHKNCRKLALKEFSLESVGKQYLEVFKQVLSIS